MLQILFQYSIVLANYFERLTIITLITRKGLNAVNAAQEEFDKIAVYE